MNTYEWPSKFSDPEYRKRVGAMLVRHVDEAEMGIKARIDEWKDAQDIFDSIKIPHTIEIYEKKDKKFDTYSWPLLNTRTVELVSRTAGAQADASPTCHAVSEWTGDSTRLDNIEHDVEFLVKQAGFDRHWRSAGFSSVIKSRGFIGVEPVVKLAQLPQDFEDTAGDPIIAEPGDDYDGQIVYAGLRFWTVKPEDFRVYPSYVQNLGDSVTHGEVTHERIADIKLKQRIGMYADANLMPSSDEDAPSISGEVSDSEDQKTTVCRLVTRILHDGDDYETVYEVLLAYDSQELLAVKEKEHISGPYFAPCILYEPDRFIPERSIFEQAIPPARVANDMVTIAVIGTAASAISSGIVSGNIPEDANFGQFGIMHIPGRVDYTPIIRSFQPAASSYILQNMERLLDFHFRLTPAFLGGSESKETTATEVAGRASGASQGLNEFRNNLAIELVRMYNHIREIIAANYKYFKAFWKESLYSDAEDFQQFVQWEPAGTSAEMDGQTLMQTLALITELTNQVKSGMLTPELVMAAATEMRVTPQLKKAIKRSLDAISANVSAGIPGVPQAPGGEENGAIQGAVTSALGAGRTPGV